MAAQVALDEHLTSCRAAREGYIGPSFPTIAGCNANGAVIHYRCALVAHVFPAEQHTVEC